MPYQCRTHSTMLNECGQQRLACTNLFEKKTLRWYGCTSFASMSCGHSEVRNGKKKLRAQAVQRGVAARS